MTGSSQVNSGKADSALYGIYRYPFASHSDLIDGMLTIPPPGLPAVANGKFILPAPGAIEGSQECPIILPDTVTPPMFRSLVTWLLRR